MKKTFWILALALGISTANAEITVLTDTDEVARSEKTVKTFVGFEANNILLLEDGSMSIATSFLDEPMVFYMTPEAIQE